MRLSVAEALVAIAASLEEAAPSQSPGRPPEHLVCSKSGTGASARFFFGCWIAPSQIYPSRYMSAINLNRVHTPTEVFSAIEVCTVQFGPWRPPSA